MASTSAGAQAGNVIFGAFMPQGWKMELAGIDGAEAKWAAAVAIAQHAEELGYDSIWVYDHVHNVPRPSHEAVFECWTTMAAISQRTSRIRLGQMVGCNSYRQPSLLAKITSTVDVISGGRLDWGIGAGWYENEYRGYGYEFPTAKDRIGMLRETVEIVRSMWTNPETTYDGQHYQLRRANCDPKPVQTPHPPIWIGGGGEQGPAGPSTDVADRFRQEHREFAPELQRLRSVADRLEQMSGPEAIRELETVRVFLAERLPRHEEEEEAAVYPIVASLMGGEDPMSSMSRAHIEISHLGRIFQQLLEDLPPEGPSPDDLLDLRRVLYGLHAILRLHFAQEEEAYAWLSSGEPVPVG